MKQLFYLSIAFSLLISQNLVSQEGEIKQFGEETAETDYYFGFNLMEGMAGMVHLVIIKPNENGRPKIRQLTKEAFINQASGKTSSVANPKNTDFFKQYNIKDPDIIDDLWRLRYVEYPYKTSREMIIEKYKLNDEEASKLPIVNTKGWSNNDSISFLPTETQMDMLDKYGIKRMTDYVYGENAFELLRLLSDPTWVKAYKESY